MTALVFAALADPNRRRIIELLSSRGSGTATVLADELAISRQAVAKHLVQLQEAGLTTSARVGRETRFAPDPAGLSSVTSWVAEIESTWASRLDRLAASFQDPNRPPEPHG